ncbi:MAG TPA: response regulator [Geopsychrobacteraceae bacterium]|nr:response regulator [Geopsychrobacteraceae bacterium]
MANVLIIEDDPDFSMSLELVLGLRDLTAIKAPSAEDALLFLEEQSEEIGLAFMDIKLPGMNGIECLRNIHSRWPDIPCVIMTGFRDSERLESARSAGAAEILLKPFAMEQFLTLVKKYI